MIATYDSTDVGRKLRELRGSKTMDEVSRTVDISVSTLAMYERGERTPRDDIKIALANYFNTTVGALFFNEQPHETCG